MMNIIRSGMPLLFSAGAFVIASLVLNCSGAKAYFCQD
jgi:hypothetical protein